MFVVAIPKASSSHDTASKHASAWWASHGKPVPLHIRKGIGLMD